MPEQRTAEQSTSEQKTSRVKSLLTLAFRLVVSIGLLVYLVLWIVPEEDRSKIITLYAGSDLIYLFIAIGLTITDRLVSSWKWLLLLRVREPEIKAGPILQIFFVSTFLGYFLPSSIGGDALRVYSISRLNRDLAGSTSSVILDRAYGTLGLLLIAAVSILPATGVVVPAADTLAIWTLTLVALLGVLMLSSRRTHHWISRVAGLEGGGGVIRRGLAKLIRAFTSFVGKKWQLFRIFSFSLLVQMLRVLIVLFLGMSLRLDLHPAVFFIYVPIITVLTFLPISIAGIGVREAAFLFFFSRPEVGLPSYASISLSLLYFSMGIVATLPGAIVYIFSGMGKKKGKSVDSGI